MLTTAEEDRIENALPTDGVQVSHGGNSYEYNLAPHWAGSDATGDDTSARPEYPAIVFDWDIQGEIADEGESIGGVDEVEYREDDEEIAEISRTRMYDDLSITIAVEAAHDENGISPQVLCNQLARTVWSFVRHDIDLKSSGDNDERPMLVEVLDPPSGGRVDRTYRLEWSARFRYIDEHEQTRDGIEEIELNADVA